MCRAIGKVLFHRFTFLTKFSLHCEMWLLLGSKHCTTLRALMHVWRSYESIHKMAHHPNAKKERNPPSTHMYVVMWMQLTYTAKSMQKFCYIDMYNVTISLTLYLVTPRSNCIYHSNVTLQFADFVMVAICVYIIYK